MYMHRCGTRHIHFHRSMVVVGRTEWEAFSLKNSGVKCLIEKHHLFSLHRQHLTASQGELSVPLEIMFSWVKIVILWKQDATGQRKPCIYSKHDLFPDSMLIFNQALNVTCWDRDRQYIERLSISFGWLFTTFVVSRNLFETLLLLLRMYELDIETRLVPNVVGYHDMCNISLC